MKHKLLQVSTMMLLLISTAYLFWQLGQLTLLLAGVLLGMIWEGIKELQLSPTFAQYLFCFLPEKEREMLMGDLDEEYCEKCEKFGKRQAQIWYWHQLATSLPPLLIMTIKKIVLRSIRRWTL